MLPPLDDELARATSEFDTLEELRGDIEGSIRDAARGGGRGRVPPGRRRRAREGVEGRAGGARRRGAHARAAERVHPQLRGARHRRRSPTSRRPASRRRRSSSGCATRRGSRSRASSCSRRSSTSSASRSTDDEIREQLREQGETDEDIEEFIEAGGADRVRHDLRMKKAVDRIAAEVKPIAPELAEAREAIWTPDKDDRPAETKLDPGSAKTTLRGTPTAAALSPFATGHQRRTRTFPEGALMSPNIPMVVEQTSRGERAFDIYSRLLVRAHRLPRHAGRRLGREPDHRPAPASRVRRPDKDIFLYINSPGGSVYCRASRSTTRCSSSSRTCRRSASASR